MNKIEEIKSLVIDILGEDFNKYGVFRKFTEDAVKERLAPRGIAITSGEFFLMRKSLNSGDIVICWGGFDEYLPDEEKVPINFYEMTENGFEHWYRENVAKEAAAESTKPKNDLWQPVEVENYEEVVEEIEGLAEDLRGENGYVEKNPLEAEYAIDISRNLAESLRNNEGKTIRKRLQDFGETLKNLRVIFTETVRIGERIAKIAAWLGFF